MWTLTQIKGRKQEIRPASVELRERDEGESETSTELDRSGAHLVIVNRISKSPGMLLANQPSLYNVVNVDALNASWQNEGCIGTVKE